jgi:hypothetical protein
MNTNHTDKGAEMNLETATKNLAEMFARKHAEMVANGATDEQAIELLREFWREQVR